MIFLIQLKTFILKRKTYKTGIAELFSKPYNKKKILNKQFHRCEAGIFLQKVTKSINSQTNIKFLGNDSLTAKLYKRVSNELSPILECLSVISDLIMVTFTSVINVRNLKRNQLLSKKELYYTHFILYVT